MIDNPRLCAVVALPRTVAHVGDLLWSLLRQPGLSFETVVAVDGARDPDVMLAVSNIADRDPRVHVVAVDAARGFGSAVSHALGATDAPFVTVAEADGLCANGGYSAMLRSLESTGSDIAVGAAEVFGKGRGRLVRASGGVLDSDSSGISLANAPGLIAHDLLCTTMARRDLLETVVASAGQDGARVVVAKAFVAASRIDVLSRSVFWHRRADADNAADNLSRLATDFAGARSAVAASADGVVECFARTFLIRDVLDAVVAHAFTDEAALAGISDLVRDAAAHLWPTSLSEISITKRWQLALIAMGHPELASNLRGYVRSWDRADIPDLDHRHLTGPAWTALGLGDRDVRDAFLDSFVRPFDKRTIDRVSRTDRIDVSVVIPAYNVAPYIDELLNSIRSAVGVRLEIIVVDDSSTDGTWERLLAHQDADSRVRALRSEGRGGGQARNLGVEVARGDYIAFADGDDLVPPHAYSHMLEVARRTDADVVSGTYLKFFSTSTWSARDGYNGAYSLPLEDLTIDSQPQLARHRAVWNRLIRRQHWVETAFPFPGVPRANDIVAMMSVLLSASSLAVTPMPVYVYRDRPGSGSMTSAAGSVDYTVSYFSEELTCAALVHQRNSTPVLNEYWRMVLSVDGWGNIRKYIDRRSATAEDDLRVANQISRLLSAAPSDIFSALKPELQAVWMLSAEGRFDDAQTLLVAESSASQVDVKTIAAAIGAASDLPALPRHVISRLGWKYLLRRLIDDRAARDDAALASALPILRHLLDDEVAPLMVVPTALENRLATAIAGTAPEAALSALSPTPSHPGATLQLGTRRIVAKGTAAPDAHTYLWLVATKPGGASDHRVPVGRLDVDNGKWRAVVDPDAFPKVGIWSISVEYEDEWGLRRTPLPLIDTSGKVIPRSLRRVAIDGSRKDPSTIRLRSSIGTRLRRKLGRIVRG